MRFLHLLTAPRHAGPHGALLLLLTLCTAQAQDGGLPVGGLTGGKSIDVPRFEEGVRIDGLLDEDLWERAALIDDFHQMDPIEYAEPSQRTEVRLFYTEDALYLGARMYETDPSQITARIMRQGESLGADDIIMLVIDPFFDRRNGYEFELNANGVREEGIYQNVTGVQRDWEGIWQGATSIDEQGWVAEIRIPFQTISFNPDTDRWGINFRRAIRRNDEGIAWVSRNRQMNPGIAGTAVGFEGLRQGVGLDVVPYVIMREERVYAAGTGGDSSVEPQLDLFYKITPQLNAALTLNTDFSATEVDNRQVNLSRFSLFFPERRDFFLRDADIFEFGRISQNGRPFFSRRMGLSASGMPLDINAGAKLSGRAGDWNLGSIFVNQEGGANTDGTQNLFVGRAALNVLSESQWGVIATHGDPRGDLDNTVVGTDFRYRNSRLPGGRAVQGDLWYQQSDSEGVDGGDAAWGLGLSSPNNAGWRGGYDYMRIEENFNPALGFVNQRGIEDHSGDIGYRRFMPAGGFLRAVNGGVNGSRTYDLASGDLVTGDTGLFLNLSNNTNDSVNVDMRENREVLTDDFTIHPAPDGARDIVLAPGDYRFIDYGIGLTFGNQRVLSGSVNLEAGEFYEGNHFERSVNLRWRPGVRVSLGLNWREDEIHLPEGHFTVRLATLSTQFNFTPTLAWMNLVQYDNVSEEVGLNSRLHWIPEAGRQAYLVLNYGMEDRDRDNDFASTRRDLTLKFNYTFRF